MKVKVISAGLGANHLKPFEIINNNTIVINNGGRDVITVNRSNHNTEGDQINVSGTSSAQ